MKEGREVEVWREREKEPTCVGTACLWQSTKVSLFVIPSWPVYFYHSPVFFLLCLSAPYCLPHTIYTEILIIFLLAPYLSIIFSPLTSPLFSVSPLAPLQVACANSSSAGWTHVVQMYDSFKIYGPNGSRINSITYR